MDYEKKYNEALERAKKILCNLGEGDGSIRDIETIFPELAESEDEKIRKEIINYILYKADGVSEEQEHSWITYLEKQKGSDLTDEVKKWKKELDRLCKEHYGQKSSVWDSPIMTNEMLVEKQKEQKMVNLEIPAGDVAPVEEDGPFDEDEFLDGELSAFLQNYDTEYDDDAAVSDMAKHFYELGKKVKQKPAEWSEEDENYLEEIIDDLKFCKKNRLSCRNGLIENCVDWLRSLRGKFVKEDEE